MNDSVVKYNHKILKDKEFILEVLGGKFSIKTMRTYRNILYADQYFNPKFSLLQDIRDAVFDFTLEELKAYVNFLTYELKVAAERKTAFLTDEFTKDKLAAWYSSLKAEYPVKFGVFSSLSECLEWLNVDITQDEVICELGKLKHTSSSNSFNQPNSFTGF